MPHIEFDREEDCPSCDGIGIWPDPNMDVVDCTKCDGTGKVKVIPMARLVDVMTNRPDDAMLPWRTDGKPTYLTDLFNVGAWWKNADDGWVQVNTIEPDYAANLLRFLERRATSLHWNYGISMFRHASMFSGEMSLLEFDRECDRHAKADPLTWLRSTQLYRNIAAQIPEPLPSARRMPTPITTTKEH